MQFVEHGATAMRQLAPGVLVAVLVSLAAEFIVQTYGGPILLLALLLGMAFHFLSEDPRLASGLGFCTRFVLRLGVALLGARITFEQIATLGLRPVVIVIAGVATTMLASRALARRLGLGDSFAALSGTAVSICGVSAALTVAAVLPQRPDLGRQTVVVCIAVTALSTIAMLLYPPLATLARFSAVEGGVFLGATIHDVAQVVGAGYSMSDRHGDVATFTKLLRVLLLAPLVLTLAALVARRTHDAGRTRLAQLAPPWFLTAFVIIVTLNSLHVLPAPLVRGAVESSQLCLVLAIAALGLRTSLATLQEVGWRPLALMVAQTGLLALVVAALLALTG